MPRAKRIERLIKRPPIFRLIDDDDWPVIMVAYSREAFPFPSGMNAQALRSQLEDYVRRGYDISVVEDENANFRAGRGIVALIMTRFNNWSLQPELIKFPWATKFNVVRGLVAFLLEVKRSRYVGVTVLTSKENSKKLLDHLAELKLIHRCGYIPNGYPDSALWSYNVSGKKQKVG